MTKMKKQRKGFTLTELAVVIAVIAILIAVLVPTFTSLINKAEESSDEQLVKNLNTSLSTYETINGETDGVLGAIAALKEEGYDVTKLTPTSNGSVIVYNTEAHAFVLYSEDFKSVLYGEEADGENLVVIGCSTEIATAASTLGVTEYCVYNEKGATINCTASNATIYVYTESGTTTINAPSADVYHYGEAETVEITAVASSSYHLYAQVETVKISKGHIAVEDGASISKLVVNTATADAVTATLNSDNATISRIVTADKEFTVKDSNENAVKISTVVAAVDAIETMDTVTYISSVPSKITSGTYVLSSNIEGNFVIPEGTVVTIDLNGFTVTGGTGTDNNVAFMNEGILTITGSGTVIANGTGTDAAVYTAYGASTYIDGGTYTQGSWYLLHNYGYMEINDATIIGKSLSSSVVHNGYYDYASDGNGKEEAVMVINGLSFSNNCTWKPVDDSDATSQLIKNDDMGNLTINDGTFTNAPAYIVMNVHKCTINGGTFSRTSSSAKLILNKYEDATIKVGQLTINGGTFNSGSVDAVYVPNTNASLEIYGGSFAVRPKDKYVKVAYAYVADGYYAYIDSIPDSSYEAYGNIGSGSDYLTVTAYFKDADDALANSLTMGTLYLSGSITQSTTNVNSQKSLTIVLINSSASISKLTINPVYDYYEVDTTSVTVDGYNAVQYISVVTAKSCQAYIINEDGSYKYCGTFDSAYKAVSDGGTIYLNKDNEIAYYNIKKNLTLDLNGHTISSTSTTQATFIVNSGYSLTITDSSTGTKGAVNSSSGTAINVKGSVTIDSGVTINGKINLYNSGAVAYVSNGATFTGSVTTGTTASGTPTTTDTTSMTGYTKYSY